MITLKYKKSYDAIKPYCKDPMLMLGAQENPFQIDFGVEYKTLDIDGGDIIYDLNAPCNDSNRYNTVFNLGTIEHVWNIHQAYVNVINLLIIDGYYLHCSPVCGFEGHGMHITNWKAIVAFFQLNGFKTISSWYTLYDGAECSKPALHKKDDVIFWYIAKKIANVDEYKCPQQLYNRINTKDMYTVEKRIA